jgi:thiamine-monophosphate kinase
MSAELDFIAQLRPLATDPGARGLLDDTAVVELAGGTLVLSHDVIVEDVHFLAEDPPGDVAWKLVAVNLSDLAAKGAQPLGVLMAYSLKHEAEWDAAFVAGLGEALAGFGLVLYGGDTVALPAGTPRFLALTAIGRAAGSVPSRSGARHGDAIWVTGTIGDAHAGLRIAMGERNGADELVERYRLPRPRLEAGQRLAPIVTAMMDVSDGLLLDTRRIAEASGVGAVIDLEAVPMSAAYLTYAGDDRGARLSAARAGDDYELLFTAPPERAAEILALSDEIGLPFTRVGRIEAGAGLRLLDHGKEIPLPPQLGYEHH